MKKQAKIAIGAGVLVVIIAVMALVFWKFMPQGDKGDKTIEIQVVLSEEDTRNFTIQTDEAYLGAALQNEKLIEGEEGQYGLYITKVDGVEADASKNQWWCITKDGEQVKDVYKRQARTTASSAAAAAVVCAAAFVLRKKSK